MDKVHFFSQTLSLLGEREYTEGTPGYEACNLWFPDVLREALRAGAWSFATREMDLGYDEYRGGYELPRDCVRLLHVGARRYAVEGRVVKPERGDGGALRVRYVSDELAQVEHVPEGQPRFVQGVRLLLAARVAPTITGDVRLSQQLEGQAWAAMDDALHDDVLQFASNDQHPLTDILNNSITL